ncbi:MAG: DNA repair protein RadC [Elusimicrobia bacterium]|nr:DNA repair protein RadC [Elusimicrobiota bacterium]
MRRRVRTRETVGASLATVPAPPDREPVGILPTPIVNPEMSILAVGPGADVEPDYVGHRKRLRQRWETAGAKGFPDYELLELLLTYVFARCDTKPLAKKLLEKFGSFKGVLDASSEALGQVEGAGQGTGTFVSLIRGAMERYFETEARQSDLLNSPEAVIAYCRASLEGLANEVFDVVYVSTKNRVIRKERLSEGTIDQAAVYPRRVVAGALAANAAGLVFVHNHPSGDPTPSMDDKRLTALLLQAAKTVNIAVLDHIIVGNGRHYSFREKGLL